MGPEGQGALLGALLSSPAAVVQRPGCGERRLGKTPDFQNVIFITVQKHTLCFVFSQALPSPRCTPPPQPYMVFRDGVTRRPLSLPHLARRLSTPAHTYSLAEFDLG